MSHLLSLDKFREAAARLKTFSSSCSEPQLFLICEHCLEEIASQAAWNTSEVQLALPFVDEADIVVREICRKHLFGGKYFVPDEYLHDKVFALVECLAVIAKECRQMQRTQQASQAQAELISYFESCGHWSVNDGTLVSEFYYERIPLGAAPK